MRANFRGFYCVCVLLAAGLGGVPAGAQKKPAAAKQGAALLTSYSGIVKGYKSIESGYADKKPELIFAVWSPQYTFTRNETKKRAEAAEDLKARFPGHAPSGHLKSPTEYYYVQSVKKEGGRVTVAGLFYSISPLDPNGEPGNEDGSGKFTHVWQQTPDAQKKPRWLLLSEKRVNDMSVYNKIMDMAGAALDKKHYAGLLP